MDDKDVVILARAIYARAVEDYINALKREMRYARANDPRDAIDRQNNEREIKGLEAWLHSDWAYLLCSDFEPETVISLCKKRAEKLDEQMQKGDKRCRERKSLLEENSKHTTQNNSKDS